MRWCRGFNLFHVADQPPYEAPPPPVGVVSCQHMHFGKILEIKNAAVFTPLHVACLFMLDASPPTTPFGADTVHLLHGLDRKQYSLSLGITPFLQPNFLIQNMTAKFNNPAENQ